MKATNSAVLQRLMLLQIHLVGISIRICYRSPIAVGSLSQWLFTPLILSGRLICAFLHLTCRRFFWGTWWKTAITVLDIVETYYDS